MRPAILFDLDGTLVDSLADIAACMNEALARSGLPPVSLEAYREHIGGGVRDLAARAGGTTDVARIDALVDAFSAAYAVALCVHTKPYAGLAVHLESLKRRGVALGVLSNKPDGATQALVSSLFSGVFDDVRGHVEGAAKKPDPSVLRAQLARLGAAREHALYVGDSEVDVETGRAAGVRVIAVTYGYRDAEALAGADERVDDVPSLAAAIDRWLVAVGHPSDHDRAP